MGEKKSMFTGMGLGVIVGVVVFICVWCFGDVLTSVFTTDTAVIQKGTEYLRDLHRRRLSRLFYSAW